MESGLWENFERQSTFESSSGIPSDLDALFHHVPDTMVGDDRPDHGLAKMRQGREHCQAGKTTLLKPLQPDLLLNFLRPALRQRYERAPHLLGAKVAALATVVGVLIEVPVMLSVCAVCNRTRKWFPVTDMS